ncbi:MAG: FtsX-like permease family protein, partial [Clostridiales bacterium]|nr:FtsX-like permease family protein [Clostridiales bacterium]
LLEEYNAGAGEGGKIVYTDYVAMMISSVTTIVNVISYVLIAFVAVSLVVSSIMIGIITYISVLERIQEIGILRALGASRKDVGRVFTAEAFIIGLAAGILGIAVSALLTLPINAVIHRLTDNAGVNAVLPVIGAIALVGISALLSLMAGFIPSRVAARKHPVEALRSE